MDSTKVYKLRSLNFNMFYITEDIVIIVLSAIPISFILLSSIQINIKIFISSSIAVFFYFLIKQKYKGDKIYKILYFMILYFLRQKKYIYIPDSLKIEITK
ncbi:hypothetical protein M1145_00530 [Patescibacteria group bacterium]|nr:hypothetical protein [Patescibacteria group bacterium]